MKKGVGQMWIWAVVSPSLLFHIKQPIFIIIIIYSINIPPTPPKQAERGDVAISIAQNGWCSITGPVLSMCDIASRRISRIQILVSPTNNSTELD